MKRAHYPQTISTVLYEWKGFQGWAWLSILFTSRPNARAQLPSKLPLHHHNFRFGRASGVFAPGADSECFAWGHWEVPPEVSHIRHHVEAHLGAGGGVRESLKKVPSPIVSKVQVLLPISCVYLLWQGFFFSLLEKVLLSWCGLLPSVAYWNWGNPVVKSLPKAFPLVFHVARHYWKMSAHWGIAV